MDQLRHMVTFARVVQAGSFAEAARRLGVTASVASKHISKLEKTLGARLLQRSTRKLSLTEAGNAYFEHCARIVEEVENSDKAVAQMQAQPRGLLRVSAPPSIVAMHIARALPDFHKKYPEITVEIDSSNRIVSLAEEGFDLALRVVTTPSPNLIARKLATVKVLLCASPKYLEQRGMPKAPEDLLQHNCLVFSAAMPVGEWKFSLGRKTETVSVQGPFRANTVEPLRAAAIAGLGVAQLPTFLIGHDLQAGRLVHVMPQWRFRSTNDLYAVYLPNRYVAPKLRVFIAYLQERFGPDPYWDRGVAA